MNRAGRRCRGRRPRRSRARAPPTPRAAAPAPARSRPPRPAATPTMSVSGTERKFDVANWASANTRPQPSAGTHASRRPRFPSTMKISTSGTNTASSGVWRPTIEATWFSGRPLTCDSVMIGTAIAPNATGAVLATSATTAARIGAKPSATSITDVIGDRRAEARERLEQRAEAERDEDRLRALVGREGAEAAAQHVEVAGRHGHVEDPQRVDHDPHDREQAVERPVQRGQRRPCPTGIANPSIATSRAVDESGQGGPLRADLEPAEQDQYHRQRQQRDQRGQTERSADRVRLLLVGGDRQPRHVGQCARPAHDRATARDTLVMSGVRALPGCSRRAAAPGAAAARPRRGACRSAAGSPGWR